MQDLIRQYAETIKVLEERREKIKASLPGLSGQDYFLAQRRISAVEDERIGVYSALSYMIKQYGGGRG